jgi:maltooligosyltrehalose synthase
VYYGEEIGMQGGVDPQNRHGMEWSKATDQNDLLKFYKRLSQIRQGSEALKVGEPIRLASDDAAGVLAFARKSKCDAAIVVLNRSNERRSVSISTSQLPSAQWQNALTGEKISTRGASRKLDFTLDPMTSAILRPLPAKPSISAPKVKTRRAMSLYADSLERTGVSN